jgi:hypothetical protein
MSNKMRDELAEKYWAEYRDANPPKGQAQFYYADNVQYWKDGFKAGLDAREAEVKELQERIETLARPDFENWLKSELATKDMEIDKLKNHFNNCNADKIVTLNLEITKLNRALNVMRAALEHVSADKAFPIVEARKAISEAENILSGSNENEAK